MCTRILTWTVVLLSLLLLQNVVSGHIKMKKGTPNVLINSPKHLLRGIIQTSRNNRPFYSFLGVRYANPPKRFQLPEPLSELGLAGEFTDAMKYGSSCARFSGIYQKLLGSEDCLYLNIFVPMKDVDESLPLPVMVYIHGGAFQDGESDSIGPEYFMDQNVILVTLNYRLGILGFLSTGDSVVPGNIALHDQALAIQFVHNNIQQFGGDPSRIVIFGESAGAACVGLQLLYPKNAGLISGAISQSGTALCEFTIQHPQDIRSNLNKLRQFLGCNNTQDSLELVECLKEMKWEDLVLVQSKFRASFPELSLPFGPVVEAEETYQSFLTQHPGYLIRTGQFVNVPYIVGVNEEEGHLLNSAVILKSPELTATLNNEWNRLAPTAFLNKNMFKDSSNFDIVSEKLRKFYFGTKEIGESVRKELTAIYSDSFFNYGTYKTAKAIAEAGGNVYPYVFRYKGEHTVIKHWFGIDNLRVVTHADDLKYLFKSSKYGLKDGFVKGSECERISMNMVSLWASFAEHGAPKNVWSREKWCPLTNSKDIFWYELDSESSVNVCFEKERFEFWDQLTNEYFVDYSLKPVPEQPIIPNDEL